MNGKDGVVREPDIGQKSLVALYEISVLSRFRDSHVAMVKQVAGKIPWRK
jgi:hypothetical protein